MSIILPNIRKIFVPDPGYSIFEADLAGADAQVVAWEAEDEDLKAAFRRGVDIHDKNAEDLFGSAYSKLSGNAKEGPKSRKRKETKQAVHATNYGSAARTLAVILGWTVKEAELFQRRWFSLHPGIKTNFHGRIQTSLRTNRTVRNRFGYHRIFFDRIDGCFPEALAWVPQSTVALVSFKGALRLERAPFFRLPKYQGWTDEQLAGLDPWVQFSAVEILLQVHDSIVFQLPSQFATCYKEILTGLEVSVPYDDPLTIPWGLTTSTTSWGECRAVKM